MLPGAYIEDPKQQVGALLHMFLSDKYSGKCCLHHWRSCLYICMYVFFCHIVVQGLHQKVQPTSSTTNNQTFFQQFPFLEQKLPCGMAIDGIYYGNTGCGVSKWGVLKVKLWHFLTARRYSKTQNSIISFGYVDSQAKIFRILYPPFENSTTRIAIVYTMQYTSVLCNL